MTNDGVRTATEPVRLTREELYEQVWSEPMSTLAPKYGISDVGLAKICRRMRIPAPGRGYWRKKEVGHAVRRIPLLKLPPVAAMKLREVIIRQSVNSEILDPTGPMAEQRQYEAVEANRIVVSETLTDPHPLVAKTVIALRRAKSDTQRGLQPKSTCLSVQVSLESADRALCIYDALLKALSARGYPTTIREGEQPKTCVRIGEEDVSITIEERIKRVERQKPQQRTGHGPMWSSPEYDWVPTGQLSLMIESYCGDGVRRTWSDAKQQRIENCLNAFIVGLVAAAEAIKARRLEQEARERELRAAEERRALEARRREEEAAHVRALNQAVAAWRRSRLIRDYIAEVHGALEQSGDSISGSPMAEWLTWAEGYANSIDPLLPTPSIPRDPGRPDSARYGWSSAPAYAPSTTWETL
jgi:hypothetical protein